MFETWGPLLGGMILLIAGGDLLVRGAVQLATRMGVSPLVIGLTLVGFGTSTPELVTSVQAGLSGAPGIAYGNVVGSNIANVLLIGGVAALLFPIAVTSAALKRDGGVMIATALVFVLVAMFLPAGRLVGTVFVAALAGYLWMAFRQESSGTDGHGAAADKQLALEGADPGIAKGGGGMGALLIALAGLVLVVVGGRFLVGGAVTLAEGLGISEAVIGLTVVAVGTSLPELVTSVVAGLKRQGEVAFGNIVGSNIYNILGISGATALIAPGPVPEQIARFDAPLMLAVTALLVALAATGLRIARSEGALLLAGYAGYVWWIWP